MTKAKKLKLPYNCFKGKILTTRKAKKLFQDREEREREVLVDIYLDKRRVQTLTIDLEIYI